MKAFILALLFTLVSLPSFAGNGTIYAQRVTPATGAAYGSPIVINTPTTGHTQSQPRVAFFNDRFLVVWQEWNGTDLDIKAARVGMDGTVLDSTPIDIASTSRTDAVPDVDADGTGWFVVWHSFPSTNVFPSLYGRRIAYDGTPGSTISAFGDSSSYTGTEGTPRGSLPRIAYNADEDKFCVVYTSFSPSFGYAHAIKQVLVSTASTPVPQTGSTDWTQGDYSSPRFYDVAAMPSSGWTYTRNGETPYTYSKTGGQVAVSIDTDGGNNSGNYLGIGKRVRESTADNSFLDRTNDPTNFELPYGRSSVATDSSYIIGVWERWHDGGIGRYQIINSDLYAAPISGYTRQGSLGGTAIATATGSDEKYPAIAGDKSGRLLVVYEKDTDGSSEIASKIITVSGTTIDATTYSEVILRTDSAGSRRSQTDVAYGDDDGGTDATNPLFLAVWTEGWWGL